MTYLVALVVVSSVMVAPADIVVEPPNDTDDPLIVIDELDKDEFGIDVNPVPDPANTVDDNVPVLGLYDNFVLEVFADV